MRLQGDGVFFGWTSLTWAGPPPANASPRAGSTSASPSRRDRAIRVWFERSQIDGGAAILDAVVHQVQRLPDLRHGGLSGALPEDTTDTLRDRVPAAREGLGSITQMDDLVVCVIGSKVSAARGFFAAAWGVLRQIGQGKPAVAPRIWTT